MRTAETHGTTIQNMTTDPTTTDPTSPASCGARRHGSGMNAARRCGWRRLKMALKRETDRGEEDGSGEMRGARKGTEGRDRGPFAAQGLRQDDCATKNRGENHRGQNRKWSVLISAADLINADGGDARNNNTKHDDGPHNDRNVFTAAARQWVQQRKSRWNGLHPSGQNRSDAGR